MLRKVLLSLILLIGLSSAFEDKKRQKLLKKEIFTPYRSESILEQLMDQNSALMERFAKQSRMKRDAILMDDDFDTPLEFEKWNDRLSKESLTTKPWKAHSTKSSSQHDLNEKSGYRRMARTPASTPEWKPATADVNFEETEYIIPFFEGSGDETVVDAEETPSSVNPSITIETTLLEIVNRTRDIQFSTTEVNEVETQEMEGSENKLPDSTSNQELSTVISTTEFGSSTTAGTTTKSMPIDSELVQENCLNTTCNVDDLVIVPDIQTVTQGVNLTITCISAHSESVLLWYNRIAGTNSSFDATVEGNQTRLDIVGTKSHHSGTYMCILSKEQTCCHRRVEIVVYEVPNYKLHLGVIGFVAGISLAFCLILGYCKKYHVKKLEKELELQGAEKPFLM